MKAEKRRPQQSNACLNSHPGKNSNNNGGGKDNQIIMSHSLLWRHIVLLTVGVYSSNHRVLYTIEISMTRFQKSVGSSVRLSVCNANKKSLLLHY